MSAYEMAHIDAGALLPFAAAARTGLRYNDEGTSPCAHAFKGNGATAAACVISDWHATAKVVHSETCRVDWQGAINICCELVVLQLGLGLRVVGVCT